MKNWWEADAWADRKPMEFGDFDPTANAVGMTDGTDPSMIRTKHGQLRLSLVPCKPSRPKRRIFTGPEKALRC